MAPKKVGRRRGLVARPRRGAFKQEGNGGQKLAAAGQLARERVIVRLDAERDLLADVLESVAGELAGGAAHGDALLTRRALRTGRRWAHQASTRLREETAEDLLAAAEDVVRKHPGYFIAGLAGAGAIAARLILARAEW